MSFPNSLTLKNAAQANIVFIRLSDDGSSSMYTRQDAQIGLPQTLRISNTQAPMGVAGNDKYLVKLTTAQVNANTGKVEVATTNFTASMPRSFANSVLNDHVAFVESFLTTSNQEMLRRGEV